MTRIVTRAEAYQHMRSVLARADHEYLLEDILWAWVETFSEDSASDFLERINVLMAGYTFEEEEVT